MSDRIAVMSAGKIQQVGTPREIYMHPMNRFVAGFIGETNFLAGTVDAGRASSWIAAMWSRRGGTDGRSGQVTLAVRPEQVRLGPAGEAGAIPARIQRLVYFGTDTHCHLRLAGRDRGRGPPAKPGHGRCRACPRGRRWACASRPARRRWWRIRWAMSANEDRQIAASTRTAWLLSLPALVVLALCGGRAAC